MRTIGIIIKHEIITTISKPSFWIMTFLFPALLLGLNLFSTSAGKALPEQNLATEIKTREVIGFVDEANLIQDIPASLPEGTLVRYADRASAEEALRSKEIDQMVTLPAGYAESGKLEVTMAVFNPLAATHERLFQYLVAYNLTGSEALAQLIAQPGALVQEHPLETTPQREPLSSAIPYAVLMIFFFLFTTSSSLMLQSVSREKVNRTAEVLLLSLEPRELMIGKILGLSGVAFFQMLVWAGGLLALNQRQAAAQAAAISQLPLWILAWVVVFFGLGYLMYASLMGAVGALSPSAKDAGQVTFFLILPLMVPMLLSTAFSEAPDGALAVILSLFPFTAPTAMLARLVLTPVPLWQICLSLGLLSLTTFLIVRAAARAFRADTLLSSTALNLRTFIAGLRPTGLRPTQHSGQ